MIENLIYLFSFVKYNSGTCVRFNDIDTYFISKVLIVFLYMFNQYNCILEDKNVLHFY